MPGIQAISLYLLEAGNYGLLGEGRHQRPFLEPQVGFAFLYALFLLIVDFGTQPALVTLGPAPILPTGILPMLTATRE